MEITNLEFDTLRHIFTFVAQSGGENLARAMAVCRMFRELGNDRDILKSAIFSSTVSDNHYSFQQFNGLLRKAAQSGSKTAQFLIAKIILTSSTRIFVSPSEIDNDFHAEDQSSSHSSYASDVEISDAGTLETVEDEEEEEEKEEEERTLIYMFLSDFETAHREAPMESLHHYHFVRMFWANCSPHDLSEMSLDLNCYFMQFVCNASHFDTIFSKFIGTAEKLSNFLRGIDELQKYRYGPADLDNQETEIIGEAHNQEGQQYDIDHDFVTKCKKFGKSLSKLKNERPDDKEFVSIIDRQFEEYEVYAETLTSAFKDLRSQMLPVMDKTFCETMDIDSSLFTNYQ